MKWMLCVMACLFGVVKGYAAWQQVLRVEQAEVARADTPCATVERAFKAEAAASAVERPYFELYTTLALARALREGAFTWGEASGEPPHGVPVQGWTRLQAKAVLERRLKAGVSKFSQYAATPAAPYLFLAPQAEWTPQSALAVLVQAMGELYGDSKLRRVMMSAAEDAGELTVLGILRLQEIAACSGDAVKREALRTMREERVWPGDVAAGMELQAAEIALPGYMWLDRHAAEAAKPEAALACVQRLMAAAEAATSHTLKVRAQMALNRMRQAQVEFVSVPEVVPIGEAFPLVVRYRNVTELYWSSSDKQRHETFSLPDQVPYVWHTTTLLHPPLKRLAKAGVSEPQESVFRFSGRIREAPEVEVRASFVAASFSFAVIPGAAPMVFVADIKTGAPVVGARVECGEIQAETDALGLAYLPTLPKEEMDKEGKTTFQVSVKEETVQARVWLPEPSQSDEEPAQQMMFLTDRALYRPGERVKFCGVVLLRRHEPERWRVGVKGSGHVRLVGMSPTGEQTLWERDLMVEEQGVFSGETVLPESFSGRLEMRFTPKIQDAQGKDGAEEELAGRGASPQVVAFRAASFRLSFERESLGELPGEMVRCTGKAEDYSAVPLTGAKVRWRCVWQGGEGEVSGETEVDAKGNYVFAFRRLSEPKAVVARVSVRVMCPTGEWLTKEAVYDFPAHGFVLRMEPEAWRVANRQFAVMLSAEREEKGVLRCVCVGAVRDEIEIPFALKRKSGTQGTAALQMASATVQLVLPAGRWRLEAATGTERQSCLVDVLPADGDVSVLGECSGAILRIKDEHQVFRVGGVVEGFAALPGKTPAFLKVTTAAGVRSVQALISPYFSLPVEEDFAPGFGVEVYGLDRGRLRTASVSLRVMPPPELKLTAEHVAKMASPGTPQTWEVTVDDPSAQMVATCYDERLEALQAYPWKTFSQMFSLWPGTLWRARISACFDERSWRREETLPEDICAPDFAQACAEMVCDGAPLMVNAGARMMTKGITGTAASIQAPRQMPAAVRTNFAKTAFWMPIKRVENGRAVFTFTLPDTLTTWRLRVLAFTPDGRSGTLTQTCVVRQEVMVKPFLPRVLRVGDCLEVRAQVVNTTAKARETWVELNRAERRQVLLPPQGTARVAWQIQAPSVPGRQTFEFASPEDTIRLEVPVEDCRVMVEDSVPITVAAKRLAEVVLEEPVPFDQIATHWIHSPGLAVAQALREQIRDWEPIGADGLFQCLAAHLLLVRLTGEKGLMPEMEEALLGKLLALRRGAQWAWMPGGEADTCATAEICLGVARLQRLGLAPKVLADAVMETVQRERKSLPPAVWAYVRSAFRKEWPMDGSGLTDVLLQVKGRQLERLAAVAARELGQIVVAKAGLNKVLAEMTVSEVWGAWWPQERVWFSWWDTPLESHALGVEVLAVNGRAREAALAAQWLLQHRRLNAWGNSRATLAAAYALLLVGGDAVMSSADAKAEPVRMTEKHEPGRRIFRFERETPGLSLGSLSVSYRVPLAAVPESRQVPGGGLSVMRRISSQTPRVGDWVTVTLTIVAAQPMMHIRLRDAFPANTEPEHQIPWWDRSCAGYVVPGDSGVDVYFGRVPRGATTFTYRLKVTHAGRAWAGLASVELLSDEAACAAHTAAYELETH